MNGRCYSCLDYAYKHSWNVCVYNTHPTSVAFMARDIISFNGIFSMFSLARLIKLMVYLKICQRILKKPFHMTENFVFFVVIPRYCY